MQGRAGPEELRHARRSRALREDALQNLESSTGAMGHADGIDLSLCRPRADAAEPALATAIANIHGGDKLSHGAAWTGARHDGTGGRVGILRAGG